MFKKVLVANRGEIACRIIRTLKKMGIVSVAVYSQIDCHSMHVLMADESFEIGEAASDKSYLDIDKIIDTALKAGVDAIHPGYGFLSENPVFAKECFKNKIKFIGPDLSHIVTFGLKHEARRLALQYHAPVLPGSEILSDCGDAQKTACKIGYPIMLKSTSGGGGIGMELCRNLEDLEKAWQKTKRLSKNNFGNSGIFIEKFIERARHIEVQIFGDGKGDILILGDRDCSVQRRNQKIIEEAPAPYITEQVRKKLHEAAKKLGSGIKYESAGTVEFIYDLDNENFYFLEVNSRLQVEHCVTESIFDIDLVEMMIKQAAGKLDSFEKYTKKPFGASIEARLYAEDPGKNFQPGSGIITEYTMPKNIRLETWVKTGSEVSPFYDPLISKIIVKGKNRDEAVTNLEKALESAKISGIETNLTLLKQIAGEKSFKSGNYTTSILKNIAYCAKTIDVISPGLQTTVQDYPGRTGYWSVGVPPSGPMDSLSHRLANKITGNSKDAAVLEATITGPELKFNKDAVVGVTGADAELEIDGIKAEQYTPLFIKKGSILKCGKIENGQRIYISVSGGFDVPLYMGSRSTFMLGKFGGHGGRILKTGDVLHIDSKKDTDFVKISKENRPDFSNIHEIGVLYGPHGAPDFFTENDIETFFNTDWEVHYNSSRTGIRLIGPTPQWARRDGGEAGLHPSNIHDNAYAVGTIDFTGDMPVILGPDGPSLGGFVCPVTIAEAELWKTGQLKPGDKIRFKQITMASAKEIKKNQEQYIKDLNKKDTAIPVNEEFEPAVITELKKTETTEKTVYRRAGDRNILVEYGEPVLDLKLRFRVHILMEEIGKLKLEGILDLTPGIRSLQIHYDNIKIESNKLLNHLIELEKKIGKTKDFSIESRIVHLPLSWDDPSTHEAIEKYTKSVRPDAPWCPSNIEFIRRINGLDSTEEVKNILFDTNYLVMGLGDVYLGAPVATPLDPGKRLVTTKYNPARTWTPENAVGIGGAYLCVYGMEGPGGYQFVGRTLQMWNRYNVTKDFEKGKPWLLRFFDQIRFYPVSSQELAKIRNDFPHGLFSPKIEKTSLNLKEYEDFIKENQTSIDEFKKKQQKAFNGELNRWIENDQLNYSTSEPVHESSENSNILDDGVLPVTSPTSGNIWQLKVEDYQQVKKGDILAIMECMKMEIEIHAPVSGNINGIFCSKGTQVFAGDCIMGISQERSL